MLLSKMLRGMRDKVIPLILLFCLFSDLVSVSDVCVLGKTDDVRERFAPSAEHVSVSGVAVVLN